MKKTLYTFAVVLAMFAAASCSEKIDDPGKNGGNGNAQTDIKVDKYGYQIFEYEGFTFKLKADLVKTDAAEKAIAHMKSDLDYIVSVIPEKALKIMRKKPIWLEENNKQNSSAAWYHTWAEYPTTYGDLAEKGKCVEITNYRYYVSWSNQNQPLMVLHELCHLYHDQGLGGEANVDITKAYESAQKSGKYDKAKYRSTIGGKTQTLTSAAYCMNSKWEYFSEMCEAYWGENDYYPFNYDDLKAFDEDGFNLMVKIWGPREF